MGSDESMLELNVTNLVLNELRFDVPSRYGNWHFERLPAYPQQVDSLGAGQCANTYFAQNSGLSSASDTLDIEGGIYELLDICLVLSFVTAKCVTPSGSTPRSDLAFLSLPQHFLPPRSIVGFRALDCPNGIETLFRNFLSWPQSFADFSIRLFLSLWVSGLTAFTLEDIFIRTAVNMDIVKQSEIRLLGRDFRYYPGMEAASKRFAIPPLSPDYKNMRNDLLHEGRLSGSKYANKSKTEVATTIAEVLNWIDLYISSALNLGGDVTVGARWKAAELEHGLPSLSL
ncbi:MAG TPA: hypothetical protein VLA05_10545 [Coriobacteriia bacterium]|nr:hypothetical protein [Coriobacteriia bacterium]